MKLLHRYIFCSVGTATLFCGGLFSFVLVAANAVKDVIERVASGQLSLAMATRMIVLLIPFTMSFALPMGLLMAILVVLGRMSARNEVVAIKSAGVSLWRMSASIIVLGAMGVVISAFVNNFYAPMARNQYRQMISSIVQEAPLRFIVPGRFVKDFPGYVIYAGEREGGKLRNVWVWVLGPDKQVTKFLQAKSGNIVYDLERNTLLLDVYEATGESRSAGAPDNLSRMRPQAVIEHASFALPMGKLISSNKSRTPSQKLSNMSLTELVAARRAAIKDMNESDKNSKNWTDARVMRTRASYYISRNFAFAYSALALAMVAIPLGIRVGRQETYANMAVAMLLGLLYFFLIFMAGWAERTPQAYPQLLVWLPNIGFQIAGILMIRKANMH